MQLRTNRERNVFLMGRMQQKKDDIETLACWFFKQDKIGIGWKKISKECYASYIAEARNALAL